MKAFTYERATDSRAAIAAASRAGAKFISGGTNLLDLMKLEIEQIGASADELGAGSRRSRDGGPGVRRSLIGEGLHRWAPLATSRMAATMLG